VFVAVGVSVAVGTAVLVGVGVNVSVAVGTAVFVGVGVNVLVAVGTAVFVGVGVDVDVAVAVLVGELVGVGVGGGACRMSTPTCDQLGVCETVHDIVTDAAPAFVLPAPKKLVPVLLTLPLQRWV